MLKSLAGVTQWDSASGWTRLIWRAQDSFIHMFGTFGGMTGNLVLAHKVPIHGLSNLAASLQQSPHGGSTFPEWVFQEAQVEAAGHLKTWS